jgi:hypothetical protein
MDSPLQEAKQTPARLFYFICLPYLISVSTHFYAERIKIPRWYVKEKLLKEATYKLVAGLFAGRIINGVG